MPDSNPFHRTIFIIQAECQPVIIIPLYHPFLLKKTNTQIIIHIFSPSGQTDLIIPDRRNTKNFIKPICPLTQQFRMLILRSPARIYQSFIQQLSVLFRITHFKTLSNHLKPLTAGNRQYRFPLASLFGCYDNYPIGTPRTVYSCSRSIFQYLHRSNIMTIQKTDIMNKHTIHNIKRTTVIGCTNSPDFHIRLTSRSSVRRYHYTRYPAL